MHIARFKSFDTIVRFLTGFFRDKKHLSNFPISPASYDDYSTPLTDAAFSD